MEKCEEGLSVKIYVAAHQLSVLPSGTDKDIYDILQVGAEGRTYFSDIRDNQGENISPQNVLYNELTGLYWIWKNCREDIVGLCHYRRFFVSGWGKVKNLLAGKNVGYIGKDYICSQLKKYDAIVHNISIALPSVEKHYCKYNSPVCYLCLKEVIAEIYPDYADAFECVMNGRKIHFLNMIIARREVVSRYAEWLFGILFETEKRIAAHIGKVPDREMGMLGERLMDVWLLKERIRTKECFSVNTEKKTWKMW